MRTPNAFLLLMLASVPGAIACSCGGPQSFSQKLPDRSNMTKAIFTAKVIRFEDAPKPMVPPPANNGTSSPTGTRSANMRSGNSLSGLATLKDPPDRRVIFQTLDSFSGPVKGSMEAFTSQSSTACGWDFIEGKSYLIEAYLSPNDTHWHVNRCSRTRELDNPQGIEDLHTLKLWMKNERPPSRITEEVWDATQHKEIGGIKIELHGAGKNLFTQTGPDGLFSFDNLPPGTYHITAALPRKTQRMTADLREAWSVSRLIFRADEQ